MLIQFSVKNYRSFRDQVVFSLLAAKLSSRDPLIDKNNTFIVNDQITLLKCAAIYGANASGKSNLVRALNFMRHLVLNSSKESQVNEPINTVPFLLDTVSEKLPSLFEVVFILDNIVYRYGFEVSKEKIESEWLFYTPHAREVKLFIREGDEITPSRNFKGGLSAKSLTRPNALFLSVTAQFNNEISTNILNWFTKVGIISGLNDSRYSKYTLNKFITDDKFKESIQTLLKDSDVGINTVTANKIDFKDSLLFQKQVPQKLRDTFLKANKIKDTDKLVEVKTEHNKNCPNGNIETVQFDLEDESEGTQKLFSLSGPIIDTLQEGKVLVIDEIEARMHTLLTRNLIDLFLSNETNPNNAQLIFATHDTNLLSNKIFRRDQIWFVEKDKNESSHLYSLAELKVRNDSSFENDYLQGKYGGIPLLGEMKQIILDLQKEDDHEGEQRSFKES